MSLRDQFGLRNSDLELAWLARLGRHHAAWEHPQCFLWPPWLTISTALSPASAIQRCGPYFQGSVYRATVEVTSAAPEKATQRYLGAKHRT